MPTKKRKRAAKWFGAKLPKEDVVAAVDDASCGEDSRASAPKRARSETFLTVAQLDDAIAPLLPPQSARQLQMTMRMAPAGGMMTDAFRILRRDAVPRGTLRRAPDGAALASLNF